MLLLGHPYCKNPDNKMPRPFLGPRGLRQKVDAKSLHLTDNLLGATQTLHHLLALLPPSDGVIALSEQVVQFLGSVHLFQELALHLVFGESDMMVRARADCGG
jgi:hypothetical protein